MVCRTCFYLFILFAIFLLPIFKENTSVAHADVEVEALLLDYYRKKDYYYKLKFQIINVTGGTERADWIQQGKIFILPVIDPDIPAINLFDKAIVNITTFQGDVAVRNIRIMKRHQRKMELPLNLLLYIATDQKIYERNSTVKMAIVAQNIGSDYIALPLPSTMQYDFVIRNSQGSIVWRWSSGKVFLPFLQGMVFAQREQKIFTGSWDLTDNQGQKVKPGAYFVEGSISTEPEYPAGRLKIFIK